MTSPKYGLQADRYRRYRPRYPDWLFDKLAEAAPGRELALELGAGSGQATADILERFDSVIAVEPDPDMAARIPPDRRLEVRAGRAEDLELDGLADAAIAATSFHWMDHAAVGQMLARTLQPGGVFLAFAYGPFRIVGPEAVRQVVAVEEADWSAYVDPRLSRWRPYPDLLRDAAVFSRVEELDFTFKRDYAARDAAGLFLTTSYATAHARETGDVEGYLEGFAGRLDRASQGAPVTVGFVVTGGLARL